MITWNVSETDSQLVLPLYSKNEILTLLHLQLLKTCEELAASNILHEFYHRWLVAPLKPLETTLTILTHASHLGFLLTNFQVRPLSLIWIKNLSS